MDKFNIKSEAVYETTISDLHSGKYDIYDYLRILYDLKKIEDYESMEGIKKAISTFGIELSVPESESQLKEWLDEINKRKTR